MSHTHAEHGHGHDDHGGSKLNLPLAASLIISAIGLVIAFTSPNSEWIKWVVCVNIVAGAAMLFVADKKDSNINLAGWVNIAVGLACFLYLANKNTSERRDVEIARAVTIIAREKLKQCGVKITQKEIWDQVEVQRGESLLLLFEENQKDTASQKEHHKSNTTSKNYDP